MRSLEKQVRFPTSGQKAGGVPEAWGAGESLLTSTPQGITKLINWKIEKDGIEINIIGRMIIDWWKRAGWSIVLMQVGCGPYYLINTKDVIHCRDVYFQIGKWGGHIAWKARECW